MLEDIERAARIAERMQDNPAAKIRAEVGKPDGRTQATIEFKGNVAGEIMSAYLLIRDASERSEIDINILLLVIDLVHKNAKNMAKTMANREDLSDEEVKELFGAAWAYDPQKGEWL